METIAEVLAKYPDCKEFVDGKGNVWERCNEFLTFKLKGIHTSFVQEYMVLPGLRPKPQKRKVTVEGFIWNKVDSLDTLVFKRNKISHADIPATLTYFVED